MYLIGISCCLYSDTDADEICIDSGGIVYFALGLSGGILAGVFNSLAVGMSPDNVIAGPIVMVLIFVIGHAINIFMNVLGAMVHPMRLTFVEFFKNSGYEGGGKEYKPFKK